MFSDHLKPIDRLPVNKLLLVAAGLVLVSQLIAMALVAGGQVEKAELRQASQASFHSALTHCVETSYGPDLKDCSRFVPAPSNATSGNAGALPTQDFSHVTNRY